MNSVCQICSDFLFEDEELVLDEGYFSHKVCFDTWAEKVRKVVFKMKEGV